MSATAFRVTGLAGILAVSCLRAMVSVQPQVIFDVDPARDALPMLATRRQSGLKEPSY